MKWWRRGRAKGAGAQPKLDEDVLVISDIHLGEDIVSTGPDHLAEYIRALNQKLTEFIATHRQLSTEGRTWHLVVNGDMFDFVKVSLRQQDGATLGDPEQLAESVQQGRKRRGGLPNTPENVVWKLGQILEIHRPLFKELATFLLEGHRITIIEGNHDAEFYFPAVQDSLRKHLIELAESVHHREKRRAAFEPAALGARLVFRSWFEASPGRYHIEHGHQYDELCSFEYKLAPQEQGETEVLATPMSHRPVPLLTEVLGDFSTHGVSAWGLSDFWRFARSLGPRVLWSVARVYAILAYELLQQAGGRRRVVLQAGGDRHREALRALSQTCPYGLATLERIDRLKAPPAEFSLFKMLHTFYLDRVLVAGATAMAASGAWLVGLGARPVLWATGTGVLTLFGLTRVRRVDVVHVLRSAAANIADATGARYVVFGHSHAPEVVNLRREFGVSRFGETSYYLNSGSWVTREILRGEAGSGMTYVQISARGAALMRWRGPEQPPLLLAGTHDEEAHATADASSSGPGGHGWSNG